MFTCGHPHQDKTIKKASVRIHAQTVPRESPANHHRANVLLSMCELSVWAKYCACFCTQIWILASFFQPVLYLILLTSLGTQQSSYTALALYNLSLRDSPNHKTSRLLSNVLPVCRKDGLKNWVVLGAPWPGPPLPWCGSGFKDKWLHVNQIWHAVQRQPPLVPWHSQTENTTSKPGKDVQTWIKAQQFVT